MSPDGSKIAYLGFEDRLLGYQNVRVYVMDRDGQNSRSISDGLDRTVEELEWAADGRSLYIQYVDKAVMKVGRLALNGHLESVAAGLTGGELDRPYTNGGEFSVASNGTVAFTSGDPTHPSDLAVVRAGRVTRLTRLNDELFTGKKLGEVRPLAVSSSFDKRPIDAWLVLPPDFVAGKKYPLILEIHGGPFASYGPVFSTDDQLYAAAGYIVVYANPARLDLVWRGIRQPHSPRLSEPRLRRSDECGGYGHNQRSGESGCRCSSPAARAAAC